MNTGKEKCKKLKDIRREVAEMYGLKYTPGECTYKGECSGICPKCDAEMEELQRQLKVRGIADIDLVNVPIETFDNVERDSFEGEASACSIIPLVGMPSPANYKKKKRVLYKECKIAGTTYRDLTDIWEELYEGMELKLVRHKNNEHDKYAIAVALAGDYDGDSEDFDFSCILGYVPRNENQHLAAMMDLGWSEIFECKISQVVGDNPFKGGLRMSIYIVSKEEYDDTSNLIRIVELERDAFAGLASELYSKGCVYFRFGGFPPWELNLPEKGEKVVFMCREEENVSLYLMHCIAVGDNEAAFFVREKETLFAIDDSCYYVFTNIKGPMLLEESDLVFLATEDVDKCQPETILSLDKSEKLMKLIFSE